MTDAVPVALPRADPARIRGLVFDLDGTLIDSYGAIATSLNHARAMFGRAPLATATIRACVGRGLEALVRDLVDPERVAEAVAAFRERYAQVYAEQTTALPGVADTLPRLAERGYRMSVASNKPVRFGRPILETLDLLRFLDAVEGPDSAGATKPEPEMIRRCLASMDVREPEALYVGDMVLDVESATRAGIPVLLVPGGSSDVATLARTGAPLLSRFEDLLDLLPREPRAPRTERDEKGACR